MPVDDVRLGLIDIQNKLCGYLWIKGWTIFASLNVNPVWDTSKEEYWDYLCNINLMNGVRYIQFSPFRDKNGRQLKEGDIVSVGIYKGYIVKQKKDSRWYAVGVSGKVELFEYRESIYFEYTGSIYEGKDDE